MCRNELLATLIPHGQEQLLTFWDRLDAAGRDALADQIRAVDLDLIARLYRDRASRSDIVALARRAEEPPAFRLDATHNRFTIQQARQRGNEALRAGEVGAMLVAGGQGTRLGFDHPKGMFPIGPVSGRSLFQIHVEKILALRRRHGVRVPLYLMTSPATHEETVRFFAEHGRFGLPEEDLKIFCQGTMPAVDAATGKLLLASPGCLAVSPDGHGGMLAAFARSGAVADARRRGCRELFYFQVDNPLVDICGAEYIGYHRLAGAEMTSQVIAKREPLEKVGNVVAVDGRLMVIEYSDLPDEVAQRRNADGSLAVWAGSIAVHVFDLAFLERMAASADALPFHYASKKVAAIDAWGQPMQPEKPNAIKFERFIFDLMPSARNAIVVEVYPARAFAPLKNAPGAKLDTPEAVQGQMIALHSDWLRRAGAEVAAGVPVEISPLFALDADELRGKVRPGMRVAAARYFQP
ncbi:MAG: UDPGP type 1 family protein [Thermoguttaceae bacterium]|jgi:UDP-N-acetylglucosamine/UDP-N-acetylgalactosamine diphosphorylase